MQRMWVCSLFFVSVFPFLAPCVGAQIPPPTANAYVPADVQNSLAGLQAQVDELVRIGKTHDQATWEVALETFALPNSGAWIAANFSPPTVTQFTEYYPKVRARSLGHMSWVLGHNLDAPGFAIKVEQSEMPAPPSATGPESLLPVPLHPVAVQDFSLTPIADSGSMPPDWVNSFVYVEGHFRIIGGMYPFWAEGLESMRRPVPADLAGHVQNAHIIHKVAPKYPKEARKNHVEGVVRLHLNIGKDGSPHDIELISGDSLLVDAAIKAVRQWRYSPTMLNGQPVDVDTTIDVIFQLNH